MKKRFCQIIIIWILCSLSGARGQYVSQVWVADQGDGTYKNPVLHADYSDPDVCAVGDDIYLTASSFGSTPGLPILHSKDLVNWRLANYALKSIEPTDFYNTPRHGKGVWAPSIRHHNGEFYIYWGDPDFGIFMVKAKDPLGEWEKPVLVKAGKGMIDPTPLWDDDGRVYLVHAWAGSRAGFNSVINVCELNAEGTKVIGNPVLVFDGNDGVNHTIEGPKFYKRGDYYYILAPAGGVATGWQLALRSKYIYGPYESKIVMAQGETDINGPHQGAWVETQTGESWFVHFQDKAMYGRVIHLNPMKWVNDWPVIGTDKDGDGCGEPVNRYRKPNVGRTYPIETPAESDEFNSRQLGLQWEWHANYQDFFGFTSDLGYLRLYGHILSENFVNFWEVPNLLLQKFPAEEFTATTKLKVSAKDDGQQSGLIVMGWNYCYLGVEKSGEGFVLKQVVCKDAEQGNPETTTLLTELPASRKFEAGLYPNYERDIYLRVNVGKNGLCRFAYSLDGKKFKTVGQAFTARQGKWIGAKVGLFSTTPHGKERGWVDADWFRVTK
ncbi:MAG: glycoside hydrolase 43 family protein [Bacteroides sp.]|nr:glycoside hydrolase 43 family protein [Bacteroides sp.]